MTIIITNPLRGLWLGGFGEAPPINITYTPIPPSWGHPNDDAAINTTDITIKTFNNKYSFYFLYHH